MTSRERVIETINHRVPDYVPIDFGGCGQTGINASTLYKLRKACNLNEHPIKICEPFQLLGEVEEDLIKITGTDVIPLWNRGNLLGLSNNMTQLWNMPDGTPVLMPDNFAFNVNEKGDTLVYPCGDRSVPYSTCMPIGSSFFDNIYRSPPFDESNLTPIEDFKENYTLKTEEDCVHWERESKHLYEETDYAIFGVMGGMGLGDIAEIPGPFIRHPKGIRDMPNWLMAHLAFPEYIEAIFDYQTEIALKNLEMYRQAVGDRIQLIWLSGTDFGTQTSLMQSKEIFNSLYKPFFTKVNKWIHDNTSWKTFYHSCGAVEPLIDDFIEMGTDIINPVQCSATGMDAAGLKKKYGERLVFWGGGINTQKTLPMGTPEEVHAEVLERLEIFGLFAKSSG
jgi:hypothetical protein